MQLIMTECSMCNYCFGIPAKTGKYTCPSCDEKNMIYVFDDDTTDEEVELASKVLNDIKDVFNSYGMEDISDIKILDLILGK